MAGVTGGSSAGLGAGLAGLAGSVSLPPGCGAMAAGNGHGGLGSSAAGQLVMSYGGDAEHKLYLESTVLERKIPEADLRQLVDLPPGLDLNEWLASHSKSLLHSPPIHCAHLIISLHARVVETRVPLVKTALHHELNAGRISERCCVEKVRQLSSLTNAFTPMVALCFVGERVMSTKKERALFASNFKSVSIKESPL